MKISPIRQRSQLVTLFVASVVLAASAHGADELPPPDKTGGVDLSSPAVIERGMNLLNTACGGYCHGTEGRGLKAPPLRNRTDLSWSAIHATVTYGRKRAGKMMPSWKGVLPDEDIWSAVAAVISLRQADGDSPPQTQPSAH
ncbi:MAG: cytochrome c [Betaproteobacteria bacterium]|nr:cytochrome c [Betaproteobacteria bacterium]